jgi:hypothetical protein
VSAASCGLRISCHIGSACCARIPSEIAAMRSFRPVVALLCAALAAFPASARDDDGPWAEVKVGGVAERDRGEHDVFVVAIDGSRDIGSRSVYTLAPGSRALRVATRKRGPSGEFTSQSMLLPLKPCMRYALAADHSATDGRWRVRVRDEQPIPDCMEAFAARLRSDEATAGP